MEEILLGKTCFTKLFLWQNPLHLLQNWVKNENKNYILFLKSKKSKNKT